MRRMSDTSHLSDTATQPASEPPSDDHQHGQHVIGGAERD